MSKITNNQKLNSKKFDYEKLYEISDAIKNAKTSITEKFDSSIRLSFNLNVDPKHADQMIRGVVIFPNNIGKTKKILAIVDDNKIDEAKKAGADYIGGENMITKIEQEKWFDYDFIVTTPAFMPRLSKLGKILGPKGLMPNPKLGTITNKIKEIIINIKKGQQEYRVDKDGNINIMFGKKSLDDKKLIENYETIYNAILKSRPATVKGQYIKNIVISSTMGPGFKIKFK